MYQITQYRMPWRLNHSQSSHKLSFETCPSMPFSYYREEGAKEEGAGGSKRTTFLYFHRIKTFSQATKFAYLGESKDILSKRRSFGERQSEIVDTRSNQCILVEEFNQSALT